MKYRKAIRGRGEEYDDCPKDCPRDNSKQRYDPYRFTLCRSCPKEQDYQAFERSTIRLWEKWFKEEHLRYLSFPELLANVYRAMSLQDDAPETIDADVYPYLSAYLSEEERMRKKEMSS